MKKITLLSTAAILLISLTARGESNNNDSTIVGEEIMDDHLSRYLTDLTNNSILPGYQSFATSSQKLSILTGFNIV